MDPLNGRSARKNPDAVRLIMAPSGAKGDARAIATTKDPRGISGRPRYRGGSTTSYRGPISRPNRGCGRLPFSIAAKWPVSARRFGQFLMAIRYLDAPFRGKGKRPRSLREMRRVEGNSTLFDKAAYRHLVVDAKYPFADPNTPLFARQFLIGQCDPALFARIPRKSQ